MYSRHSKLLALTLALTLAVSAVPIHNMRAAEQTGETADAEIYDRIDIRTPEEFADFASKCYIDSWSENKYVSLKSDIDLSGTEIRVIPVFNGVFDGVGHTISGFDYLGDGYVVGLFRYVEKDGVIQNLTLKGNVESENQKECIGSLCGVNYGTIKNCTFQGTVSGRDTVGGIVGINGDTGIVTGCSAKGRITGYYSTGGIAGINHGTLNYCSNRAGINDDSAWVEEDDEMGTGMGIIESLTTNDDNELYSGVDTGGIAGFSDGMIVRCTNAGTVGYEHTGYNIGGIAGRQSGVVSLSTNNGTVYGRKDIGGIVGQMEPFIEISEAESLRNAVDKLHDLIDKTIDDMQATKDGVKRDFDTLTVFSDNAVDAADVLAEQIGDFVDDNLDQVQAMTDRLDHVMEMTPEVFNDFEAAENSFGNAVEALKNIADDLGKITDISDEPYDVSKNKRITLLHTVGGYIISDSYNPKAGEEVTITVKTDGTNYTVRQMNIVKVTNGETITYSSSADQYTFTMPVENVRVEVYFDPGAGIEVVNDVEITDNLEQESGPSEAELETETETETETEMDSDTEEEEETESSDTETEEPDESKVETETEETEESESSGESQSSDVPEEEKPDSPDSEENSDLPDSEENSDSPDSEERSDSSGEMETQAERMIYFGAGASFLGGAVGGDENGGDNSSEGDEGDGGEDADSNNPSESSEGDGGEDADSNNPSESSEGNGGENADNKLSESNEDDDGEDADSDETPVPVKKPTSTPRAADPVVKITSNLSGSASCLSNDDKDRVTITAEPSGGYTVEYVTLNGSRKSPDSGNSYSFPVESDKEYNVYIQFRRIATKSGAVENAKSEIEYAIREAQAAANKIKDIIEEDNKISEAELQKMLSATTTVMENTEILADIYGKQAANALKAVNKDLSNTSDHLRSAIDSVKAATRHTRDIVDYMNSQPAINFTKLGAEYDYNRTNLHNQLQGISDSLKMLSDNASNYSDVVNADLKAVNDQINIIFNLLADRLSDVQKLSLSILYEDVDDEDIDSITTGRTESCSNKGVIKGDINVGGIAGSMSIDDEDPEDSAAGAIEYELGRRFITKCLVTDSVNEGYVTSKKNGAGGICGYMNHGIIVDSESYGSVESTEGDYVGGICGESLTIIKRCYSLCSVVGNKNVGGIAGYADTLKNCYSMADVQAENGRAGAIAGQISGYDIAEARVNGESEDNAGPKVADNYYVGEDVHGIDNISYTGVAEPIDYEELLAVEQLPAQFSHLKVIYRIDDIYLGSEEVKYGARLDKLNYPQIPEKEGYYGVWPDVSDKKMGGIFVVEGEYKNNVTVVQSSGEAEVAVEGQRGKPYALIEDIFTEDTVLDARISDMTPPQEAVGKQNVVYEVTLANSGINETDSFSLRILNPYEDAIIYGYKDGAWTELESKSRGQYLQVNMTGTQEYFCVVENKSNMVFLIVCVAAAAVVVILLIILIKKAGARRKQRRQKKAEEKEQE